MTLSPTDRYNAGRSGNASSAPWTGSSGEAEGLISPMSYPPEMNPVARPGLSLSQTDSDKIEPL